MQLIISRVYRAALSVERGTYIRLVGYEGETAAKVDPNPRRRLARVLRSEEREDAWTWKGGKLETVARMLIPRAGSILILDDEAHVYVTWTCVDVRCCRACRPTLIPRQFPVQLVAHRHCAKAASDGVEEEDREGEGGLGRK